MKTLFWILLVAVLPFLGLVAYNAVRLRRMPLTELERAVVDIPHEYFAFLGPDKAPVQEFSRLIRERDFASLYAEWPRLEKAFLAAERERGHRGRPLIMDYFMSYRSLVGERLRRIS